MAVVTVTTEMVAGVKYTHTTADSADWSSISNDTYFYDIATKIVYYKDSSGNVINAYSSGGGGGDDPTVSTKIFVWFSTM